MGPHNIQTQINGTQHIHGHHIHIHFRRIKFFQKHYGNQIMLEYELLHLHNEYRWGFD